MLLYSHVHSNSFLAEATGSPQTICTKKQLIIYNIANQLAILDISVNGFWGGRCEKTLMLKFLIPMHLASNHSSSTRGIYRRHENIKKRSCEAQIHEVV